VTLLLNRPVRLSDMLALSLIAVLVYDPFAVLNAGFWLSYAAVILILITCTGRFPKPNYQWLTIHLWIAFGLIPLLILLFGQFSIVAPLSNLWAVPFVSLVIIPILFISLMLLWLWPTFGLSLIQLTDWLLNILWQGLSAMAAWPMADLSIKGYPPSLVALLGVGILMCLLPRGIL
jgi:competence protein ComEC